LIVFGDAAAIQYDLPWAFNRKPRDKVAGAASLVVRRACATARRRDRLELLCRRQAIL